MINLTRQREGDSMNGIYKGLLMALLVTVFLTSGCSKSGPDVSIEEWITSQFPGGDRGPASCELRVVQKNSASSYIIEGELISMEEYYPASFLVTAAFDWVDGIGWVCVNDLNRSQALLTIWERLDNGKIGEKASTKIIRACIPIETFCAGTGYMD